MMCYVSRPTQGIEITMPHASNFLGAKRNRMNDWEYSVDLGSQFEMI